MSESAISTLLVTQDSEVASQMEGLLKQATGSFSLTRSDSARSAVDACKSKTPDCILYEQNGSDDDGVAFLQQLAEHCGPMPAPVIVLVREEKKPQLAKFIKSGAADYLLLPALQPDTLSRTVRYALERRVLEKRLMEQRNLFKAVLGGSPGFIALKNETLQYQAVNGAFCAFLGKSQEDIVGKGDESLFSKKDAETYKKDDAHVLKNGVPQIKRIEITGTEGPRWFDVVRTPIFDAAGAIAGVFFAAHDVTAAKELETQLDTVQGTLRRVSEDQAEMVCRVAAKGILTFVNEATCRAFGKSESDLTGQGFSTLIPKDSQTEVRNLLASLKPNNATGSHRQRVVVGNGPARWQEWTTRAIYGDDGKLAEFICVGHDVTPLVELEEAATQLKTELAAKESALAELSQAGQSAEHSLASLQQTVAEKEAALAKVQQEMDQHRQAASEQARLVEEKANELKALQERLGQAEGRLGELESALGEKDGALAQSRQEAESHEKALRERESLAGELERRVQESEQLLKSNEAALAEREAKAREAQQRVEQLELELQGAKQRHDDLLALIPSGIMELAAGMKITSMTPAVHPILGCSAQEAEGGLVLLDFLQPEDKKGATECMKESMQQRKVTSGEYRIVRRDGTRTDVVLTAAPLVRDTKIMGMMVALTDVSAGKQAGKTAESIRRLAGATAATASMLSGVARLTAGLVDEGAQGLDAGKLERLELAARDARSVLEDLLSDKPRK
jgi:PAS domain S-box-containing protein